MIQRFLLHAYPGVGNGELHVAVFRPCGNFDLAFFGKLCGIAQEIEQNLFKLVAVGLQRWKIGRNILNEAYAPSSAAARPWLWPY